MIIAQFSDLHIRPAGQRYQGVVDSNQMFVDAVDHLHGLDRQPDLVLITGDLVDEGRPAEYAKARDLLARLRVPTFVLPGNHDTRDAFRQAFGDRPYLPSAGAIHYSVDDFPLRIIALDTTVPGRHHGALEPEGLSWLRTTLQAQPQRPTLLLMHHPPFACGIPYLDRYRYLDPDPLADIVRAHPQVEAVLCGHVHRMMMRRWAGTIVMTCPSTTTEIALQLAPDAPPASHGGPPGFLLHCWETGTGLVSHLCHVGAFPGPYPFA